MPSTKISPLENASFNSEPEKTSAPQGICPLPWLHFSVNADTSLRVCCNTDHGGHIRDESGQPFLLSQLQSVDEAFNSPFMKQFRLAMMRGEKPRFCDNCYRIEHHGGTSLRQIYLKQFDQKLRQGILSTSPDGHAPGNISFLDLSLGNGCNLKCRMCGPNSSYPLKEEFDQLGFSYSSELVNRAHHGWEDETHLLSLFEKILPHLTEMLTTGGEPFLSRLHVKILELAIEQKVSQNIILRYHSNLTIIPPRLIELWKSFKAIELHVSLEAYGPLNDYIRYPSQWTVFDKNFAQMRALKKSLPLWIEVHTCFQAYNLLRLPQLLKYLSLHRKEIPAMPYFISLQNPSHLAAQILPAPLLTMAIEELNQFLELNQNLYLDHFEEFNQDKMGILRSHLNSLMSSTLTSQDSQMDQTSLTSSPPSTSFHHSQNPHWLTFIKYTNLLDRHRHQSLLEHIPELKPFWRS